MTDQELKPCAHCGASETLAAQSPISDEWRFNCLNCWSTGAPAVSRHEAITAWNTRADRQVNQCSRRRVFLRPAHITTVTLRHKPASRRSGRG